MDDLTFFNCFSFNRFRWRHSRHTDNSQGISRHHIGFIREGEGLLISDTDRIEVTAGDLFFIPKGCRYHSHWQGDIIDFDSFGFDAVPLMNDCTYRLQKAPLTETAKNVHEQLCSDYTVSARSVGLLYTLLGELMPHLSVAPISRQSDLANRIVRQMSLQPSAPIGQIAEICGVSESTVYLAFRKSFQKTPNAIRQEIKCDKAVQLLTSTSLPVEEISELAGFSSSSYFRKILFHVTGKTPRQIRKETHSI